MEKDAGGPGVVFITGGPKSACIKLGTDVHTCMPPSFFSLWLTRRGKHSPFNKRERRERVISLRQILTRANFYL